MISAVIPAYNEEKNIKEVIERTLPFSNEVIVVNDGSTDKTGEILEDLKDIDKLKIVDIYPNAGKADAIREGIKHVTSDIVVFLDGDLQHLPEEIPRIVEPILNKDADIVIGNRRNNGMPLHRRLSNLLVTKLCCLKTKKKINDVQCGFRAAKRNMLDKIKLKGKRYTIELSMFIESVRKNHKIVEVPINCIYNGSKSRINAFKDSYNFIKFFLLNQ